MIMIDTKDFPALDGQEIGRELDLELTAVVTDTHGIMEGGSPSLGVTLVIVRADISQTT